MGGSVIGLAIIVGDALSKLKKNPRLSFLPFRTHLPIGADNFLDFLPIFNTVVPRRGRFATGTPLCFLFAQNLKPFHIIS